MKRILHKVRTSQNAVTATFGSGPVHSPRPFLERLALSDRGIGPNCVLRLAHSVRPWAQTGAPAERGSSVGAQPDVT